MKRTRSQTLSNEAMSEVVVKDTHEATRPLKAAKRTEGSSPSTANSDLHDDSEAIEMDASAEALGSARDGVRSALAALKELGADPELVASYTLAALKDSEDQLSGFLSLREQPRLALRYVAVWFSTWEAFVDFVLSPSSEDTIADAVALCADKAHTRAAILSAFGAVANVVETWARSPKTMHAVLDALVRQYNKSSHIETKKKVKEMVSWPRADDDANAPHQTLKQAHSLCRNGRLLSVRMLENDLGLDVWPLVTFTCLCCNASIEVGSTVASPSNGGSGRRKLETGNFLKHLKSKNHSRINSHPWYECSRDDISKVMPLTLVDTMRGAMSGTTDGLLLDELALPVPVLGARRRVEVLWKKTPAGQKRVAQG
eukprot:Amastigsp_a175455_117.p1 type:complete len:372 gc:universal Amastigsp_a175455_117:1169-54(-)